MALTRDEATKEACAIVALAYRSVGDYSEPSDGFCSSCPAAAHGFAWSYHNAGKALAFVRAAVVEKLARDGYAINPCFNADGTEKPS